MQIKVTMDTCYKFRIAFSSSYEIAEAFAQAIGQRDDVWKVDHQGLDVYFVTTSSGALRKFAHDFEREWLELKIAQMESKLSSAAPSSVVPLATVRIENFESSAEIATPSVEEFESSVEEAEASTEAEDFEEAEEEDFESGAEEDSEGRDGETED